MNPRQIDTESVEVIDIHSSRICSCKPSNISCITAKEWVQRQKAIWEFFYTKGDIRDRKVHPAVFPISLASHVIETFTHKGELVVDPFAGIGTSLVAAMRLERSAIGFDLNKTYLDAAMNRLWKENNLFTNASLCQQVAVRGDARDASQYLCDESVKLIWTSPPYANVLNRRNKNKSRAVRKDEFENQVLQYSQNPNDLGTLDPDEFVVSLCDILDGLAPKVVTKGHCVVNVADVWIDDNRIPLQTMIVSELSRRGKWQLRNTIIWDKGNLVNKTQIFGWPSNFITVGATMEYLIHFRKAT